MNHLNKISILDIIESKKNKKELSLEEINFFVESSINKSINESQIAAMIQLIYLNGMTLNETIHLVKSMINNSLFIKLKKNKLPIIDKHSTGGIGDKVSLVICPLLATLGVLVPKLSGRGLGITGGTIDKLDSVNANSSFNVSDYSHILKKYGFFISQQTNDIVPSDKIFYSIRNDICAVDSLPLILSSILSKKFIINSDRVYLDVKVGSGAFFKTLEDGVAFSNEAIKISNKLNRKITCFLTDMNEPLGSCVGNKIEIYEVLNFLKGNFLNPKFKKYIYELVSRILMDFKLSKSEEDSFNMIDEKIISKEAYNLFINYLCDNGSKVDLHKLSDSYDSNHTCTIKSWTTGYLEFLSNETFGRILIELKAGRESKEEDLDYDAGIYFIKTNNEKVQKGEDIIKIFSSNKISSGIINQIKKNIHINKTPKKDKPKIYEIIKN